MSRMHAADTCSSLVGWLNYTNRTNGTTASADNFFLAKTAPFTGRSKVGSTTRTFVATPPYGAQSFSLPRFVVTAKLINQQQACIDLI